LAEGLIQRKITRSAFAAQNPFLGPEVSVLAARNVFQHHIHALLSEPGNTEPSAIELT
jgi:hypothetical protein